MKDLEILIVDDDPIILLLHKRLLSKSGICKEPIAFKSGEDALDYLASEASAPTSYLILLDINMPEMNAWEFLDELGEKDINYRINVAIVSSSIDRVDQEKAEAYALVKGYLTKPLLKVDPIYNLLP